MAERCDWRFFPMYQEDAVRMMIRRRCREEKRARVILYATIANVAAIGAVLWFVVVNLR